ICKEGLGYLRQLCIHIIMVTDSSGAVSRGNLGDWEETMVLKLVATIALGMSAAWTTGAFAQETVKVGLILPYSGPFADAANQLEAGVKLYMEKHGDEVAGKKIEIIRKDTGGPNADVARRLAQELVVRDGADILAGFALTPEAIGAAEVATEAKKLT